MFATARSRIFTLRSLSPCESHRRAVVDTTVPLFAFDRRLCSALVTALRGCVHPAQITTIPAITRVLPDDARDELEERSLKEVLKRFPCANEFCVLEQCGTNLPIHVLRFTSPAMNAKIVEWIGSTRGSRGSIRYGYAVPLLPLLVRCRPPSASGSATLEFARVRHRFVSSGSSSSSSVNLDVVAVRAPEVALTDVEIAQNFAWQCLVELALARRVQVLDVRSSGPDGAEAVAVPVVDMSSEDMANFLVTVESPRTNEKVPGAAAAAAAVVSKEVTLFQVPPIVRPTDPCVLTARSSLSRIGEGTKCTVPRGIVASVAQPTTLSLADLRVAEHDATPAAVKPMVTITPPRLPLPLLLDDEIPPLPQQIFSDFNANALAAAAESPKPSPADWVIRLAPRELIPLYDWVRSLITVLLGDASPSAACDEQRTDDGMAPIQEGGDSLAPSLAVDGDTLQQRTLEAMNRLSEGERSALRETLLRFDEIIHNVTTHDATDDDDDGLQRWSAQCLLALDELVCQGQLLRMLDVACTELRPCIVTDVASHSVHGEVGFQTGQLEPGEVGPGESRDVGGEKKSNDSSPDDDVTGEVSTGSEIQQQDHQLEGAAVGSSSEAVDDEVEEGRDSAADAPRAPPSSVPIMGLDVQPAVTFREVARSLGLKPSSASSVAANESTHSDDGLKSDATTTTTILASLHRRYRFFVRALPPFAERAFDTQTAPWEHKAVQEHDVWRLARLLSCEHATPLSELRVRSRGVITTGADLVQIVLGRPELFSLVEGRMSANGGVARRALRDASLEPPTASSAAVTQGGAAATVVDATRREAGEHPPTHQPLDGYVTFVVPELYRQHAKYANLDVASAQAEMAVLAAQRKTCPNHRKLRLTRQIMQLKQQIGWHHSRDHPLQHPDVLAHLCFDILPAEVPVPVQELWRSMPHDARNGPTLTNAFFERYKHLFFIWHVGFDPCVTWIQRTSLPTPIVKTPEEYTEEELIFALKRIARHAEKDGRATQVSFVQGRVNEEMRRRLNELGDGDVAGFIRKHPAHFCLVPMMGRRGQRSEGYRLVAKAQLPSAVSAGTPTAR